MSRSPTTNLILSTSCFAFCLIMASVGGWLIYKGNTLNSIKQPIDCSIGNGYNCIYLDFVNNYTQAHSLCSSEAYNCGCEKTGIIECLPYNYERYIGDYITKGYTCELLDYANDYAHASSLCSSSTMKYACTKAIDIQCFTVYPGRGMYIAGFILCIFFSLTTLPAGIMLFFSINQFCLP